MLEKICIKNIGVSTVWRKMKPQLCFFLNYVNLPGKSLKKELTLVVTTPHVPVFSGLAGLNFEIAS